MALEMALERALEMALERALEMALRSDRSLWWVRSA
jgi:hypothetical protein